MNFDEMKWLVTADDTTYGTFDKNAAVAYRDDLRAKGQQAEAWAAQLPDERKLTKP